MVILMVLMVNIARVPSKNYFDGTFDGTIKHTNKTASEANRIPSKTSKDLMVCLMAGSLVTRGNSSSQRQQPAATRPSVRVLRSMEGVMLLVGVLIPGRPVSRPFTGRSRPSSDDVVWCA